MQLNVYLTTRKMDVGSSRLKRKILVTIYIYLSHIMYVFLWN